MYGTKILRYGFQRLHITFTAACIWSVGKEGIILFDIQSCNSLFDINRSYRSVNSIRTFVTLGK